MASLKREQFGVEITAVAGRGIPGWSAFFDLGLHRQTDVAEKTQFFVIFQLYRFSD